VNSSGRFRSTVPFASRLSAADAGEVQSALGKGVDVVVALPGSRGQGTLDRRRFDLGVTRVHLRRGLDKCGAVALEDALHDLVEVVEQVPAVGDLPRLRCAGTRALRVRSSSIAADDFDAGMLLQPRGQCRGRAVAQHIDRAARVHVHEHGAVGVAAAHRELVNADDPKHAGRRHGQSPK